MGLEIQNLTKRFGSQEIIRNLSLSVADREFVSLVGPSGCGKTTLLRIVAGLESADAGSISITGQSVLEKPPRDRDVAMVFQGESLYPHMSVGGNLAFPLKMRGRTSEEITSVTQSIAAQLGLEKLLDRMPNSLSGGQRQRVALGRALVRNPKVFLLDEPFSHLDAHLRRQLREELRLLRKDWTATTLFVTHDQREAMSLGDRVAVMHDGEILQFDSPNQIRAAPANDFVAEFLADEYGE